MRARYLTSDGMVMLSSSAQHLFEMWASELRNAEREGVPLAASEAFPAAQHEQCMSIYADVAGYSAGAGFCAWTVRGSELLLVEGRWSEKEGSALPICDLDSEFGAAQHSCTRSASTREDVL